MRSGGLSKWHINQSPLGRDGLHRLPRTGCSRSQSSINRCHITLYTCETQPQVVNLKLQKADSELQILDPKHQTVDSELQILDSKRRSLDPKLQTVDSELQILDSKLHIVDSKLRTLDSKPQRLDLKLQNHVRMAVNSSVQKWCAGFCVAARRTRSGLRAVARDGEHDSATDGSR